MFPECKLNMVGERDTIIEYIPNQPKENKIWLYLKIIFASVILFAGAATAIMSFHTDAQIPQILEKYYHIFFGEQADKTYIIEIPYSIGLALGIIVFYNHFFKWKLTEDPTPLQVEMSSYEKDVDECMLDNLTKKGGN
jgi:stage V sporulation protein AA